LLASKQNCEVLPTFYAMLLFAGIGFPAPTAIAGYTLAFSSAPVHCYTDAIIDIVYYGYYHVKHMHMATINQ
jgi:hypothetical protein